VKGLHVAVTGASSGIGEGIAREAAAAGAKVSLVARRKELLDGIAASLPGERVAIAADLGAPERCTAWIAEAEKALGPIDVLVNNAGVQIVGQTAGSDPEAGERLLDLDLAVPMRLCLAVLPAMLARRSGTIVNVASLAGIAPTPGMFYYNAAKGGLGCASESLRGELRGSGVNVVTVYPGPVTTAMETAARTRYEASAAANGLPTGDTATLARLIRRAVERRSARIIYPRVYWAARWFPGITRFVIDRSTPKPLPPEPKKP
jgi:short-subunit dehydrogenase